MRGAALVLAPLVLLACAGAEPVVPEPEPAPPPPGAGPVRSAGCDRSFTPTRDQLARSRRVDAGPADLVVPRPVRSIAEAGGVKLPVLVDPGTGAVELRLRVDRSAGFTASPGGLRREAPPLPPDAVKRLRFERCPPVPPEAQELRGEERVAYAAWVAVTRDQCVPVDVVADGRRRRVRLSLGLPCSP